MTKSEMIVDMIKYGTIYTADGCGLISCVSGQFIYTSFIEDAEKKPRTRYDIDKAGHGGWIRMGNPLDYELAPLKRKYSVTVEVEAISQKQADSIVREALV